MCLGGAQLVTDVCISGITSAAARPASSCICCPARRCVWPPPKPAGLLGCAGGCALTAVTCLDPGMWCISVSLSSTVGCAAPLLLMSYVHARPSLSLSLSRGPLFSHLVLPRSPAKVNPEKRLGCGPGGIAEIKHHRWFSHINWSALAVKQLHAPIVPRLSSLLDTSNFDSFDDADFDSFKFGGQPGGGGAAGAAAAQGGKGAVWDTWQWSEGLSKAQLPQGSKASHAH